MLNKFSTNSLAQLFNKLSNKYHAVIQKFFPDVNPKWFPPIFVVLITIIGLFILINNASDTSHLTTEEKSWLVEANIVRIADQAPNLILFGKTESPHTAKMSAAVEADVIQTPIKEGVFVTKGQLLMVLDDRDAKLLLQQRISEVSALNAQIKTEHDRHDADKKSLEHEKALLTLQEKAVSRQRVLSKQQLGSEERVDIATRSLQERSLAIVNRNLAIKDHPNRIAQLDAQLEKETALQKQAELDLKRTKIYAPFDGRITKKHVAMGNRVRPGDLLIELYDIDNVEVRAQIPSQYLPIVRSSIGNKKNTTAKMIVDEKAFNLKLHRLAGEVPRGHGGLDALFKVLNNGKSLALGRSVELILTLPIQTKVISLPETSLFGSNTIYKISNDRLKTIHVERVGQINQPDGRYRVLIRSKELKNGDKVLSTQLPNARTGLRVKVDTSDQK